MEIQFKQMTLDEIEFFNSIRNECRDSLHDNSFFSLDETREWFIKNNPLFFIIFINDQKIGYFRTSNLSHTNKNIYIGADIHKDYRGKGYSKKAYKKFIPYIIEKYNLHKINLEVLSTNKIAINLYLSLGFKIDGIKREEVFRDNKFIDSIVMSLLKKDWEIEK